jgi:hypothetical protein
MGLGFIDFWFVHILITLFFKTVNLY